MQSYINALGIVLHITIFIDIFHWHIYCIINR